MKNKLLLPRACRIIGLILLPFAITLLFAVENYNYSIPFLRYNMPKPGQGNFFGNSDFLFGKNFYADFSNEVALLATFVCLFMVAFSKQKKEDEYVSAVRLRALQISVYANYIILALSSILIYGVSFLVVMEINLFTILILFILIFNFNLHIRPRLSKSKTA